MKEFIEVTINFSLVDVERKEEGFTYLVKWVDGKMKEIQNLSVMFAVESMAQAMFIINGLLVINPNTKSFKVQKR